jgi:bifunctional non-homologous end joining protein LigD
MILVGKAVLLDEQGRWSFSALQKAFGGRGGKRNASEVIFSSFDLLYLDGYDLTKLGQHERRHLDAARLSKTIEADGDELLKQACELD